MQRAEDQEDLSDLDREQLQSLPGAVDVPRRPHGQRHETEVEQVETDHEQPVDRIGQAVVPVEDTDTEDSLSARILKEEHRIYSEAVKIVLEGKYKIAGRRVLRSN